MALLENSVVNSLNITAKPEELAALQSYLPSPVTTLSSQTTNAISGVANSSLGSIQGINGNIKLNGINIDGLTTGTTSSVNSALNQVTNLISGNSTNIVSSTLGQASNYLNSAIKSVTSTFDGAVKSLAKGIDSQLGSIFKDTNKKDASAVVSEISDPIKTNLLNAKPPASSSFKISSLEAGSQAVGFSGSSSQFGTNAGSMIGTNLSTVLNRLNLDSVTNLANSITNAKSSLTLGGLFSNVKNVVKNVQNLPTQIVSNVSKSLSNDLQTFLGRSSGIQDATGVNPLSFFLSDSKFSLLDENGNPVDTNGSGIDATSGNSILDIIRFIGCSTPTSEYKSVSEFASLYNLILQLASKSGMASLVDSLLNCSAATNPLGQTAISNTFKSVAAADAAIAAMVIDKVDNKAVMNDELITQSIVTNTNLKASDKSTVDYIMMSVGTTTEKAYSTSTISSDTTLVYNTQTLSSSSKSFMDSVFGDTAFSTYVNGTAMSLQADGTFAV